MDNHIIAICGPRGSGKSTLAALLERDKNYIRTSFAYPLKKMLTEFVIIQGCPYNDAISMFYGDLKNTPSDYFLGKTPRYAMQTLGAEWGRDLIHPDLWSNAWRNKVSTLLSKNFNIVVDDLRFLTEEKIIRTFENTTIVRIHRVVGGQDSHRSEAEFPLISADIDLPNQSTPNDMYKTLIKEMK
jgi:hypothetical protein